MSAQTVALILIAAVLALSSAGGIGPESPGPAELPNDRAESAAGESAPSPGQGDGATEAIETPRARQLAVLGYYMQDAAGAGRASLLDYGRGLTALAPWSWGLTKEGELRPVYFRETDLAETLAFAGGLGLETHLLIHNFDPVLGSFDGAIADAVLTQARVQAAAVERIAKIARDWGVSGVHIDFEGVAGARRDDLTAFMARLRDALSSASIGLSIAVPAKTFATAHTPWTNAYDYGSLARHVDFIMIMAYDQHWPGGDPGPVAGLPWVRSVVEYALSPSGGNVPAHQVVLGMAAYGYDWPLGGTAPGESVTFKETSRRLAQALAADPTAAVGWDDEHLSPYLNYFGRKIWFENAGSLAYKLQLALDYELGGVALWRLGQEDPRLWDRLGALD